MAQEFYAFMIEREAIRMRRVLGLPREEWTNDPIFQTYKFTNVRRADDRTTRDLMTGFYHVYDGGQSPQLMFNCAIARFFGWSPTVIEIGWRPLWDDFQRNIVEECVNAREARGDKVFTGAYMIPNCGDPRPKLQIVLEVIDQVAAFAQSQSFAPHCCWEALTNGLCYAVKGMGSFMAKVVLLDYIQVSGLVPCDWETWTPVGPGARRGAARVLDGELRKPGGLSEPAALEVCRQLYDLRKELWTYTGSDLALTDIQFQLCEFDKYMRVRDGGRAKTIFRPSNQKLP